MRGHQHWPSGAVHEWCGSRRHSPGGSAGREGEDTSTGLEWQCVDGAGVGGTSLAAVLEEKKTPVLAQSGSAWKVQE